MDLVSAGAANAQEDYTMIGFPVPVLYLTMVLAGIGIPVMAALNGGLNARLNNPALAATLLFALAFVISIIALLLQSRPVRLDFHAIPLRFFLGGVFVTFYVLSVTSIAPKIGVGNAIALVLLGQTLSSAVIDHHGWFGAPQATLTAARAVGWALIVSGALIANFSTVRS